MTRYDIDDKNRLVITRKNGSPLVAHGRFCIDADNRLRFTVDEPTAWRRRNGLPGQLVFEGAWQLDENHDLVLVLTKTATRRDADRVTLKGTLVSAHADALMFEVVSWDADGLLHAQLLKLSVVWSADSTNRLVFTVRRLENAVALESGWQLNENQQITYRYEKFDLVRKARVTQELTFDGSWQLGESRKLTYFLGHSSESKFEFRAQVETPTIYPQQGVIKYRLGAGVRQARSTGEKIVCLYGAWKISRSLRLSFTMDYGQAGIQAYEFASDIVFSGGNTVTFVLKSSSGEALGIQLIVTHRFIKQLDGDIFLRLEALRDQYGVYAGVRIPF